MHADVLANKAAVKKKSSSKQQGDLARVKAALSGFLRIIKRQMPEKRMKRSTTPDEFERFSVCWVFKLVISI